LTRLPGHGDRQVTVTRLAILPIVVLSYSAQNCFNESNVFIKIHIITVAKAVVPETTASIRHDPEQVPLSPIFTTYLNMIDLKTVLPSPSENFQANFPENFSHKTSEYIRRFPHSSHVSRPKSACYPLHAGFFLGLFFEPEDGGDMFLRNAA
jgi:hypothetical protein